jgi:hypothetical protein
VQRPVRELVAADAEDGVRELVAAVARKLEEIAAGADNPQSREAGTF